MKTKFLKENILFQNNFITIAWMDTRLDLFDSDGKYIEYFFDACFYEEKEQEEMIQSIINDVTCANEEKLVQWISEVFDSIIKIVSLSKSTETIESLCNEWGSDYVNRVGNFALIIKE